tara:strand:+ start:592 stop:957 length:366 start_codon:yes stop_codon:yes gene_type:complete
MKKGDDGFLQWLEMVPASRRKALTTLFAENTIASYDDLVRFSQRVMVEVLSGNIPPCVADAAGRWAEITLTALAAKNTASGTPGDAYSDLVDALIAVREEAPVIEASYTTDAEVLEFEEAV